MPSFSDSFWSNGYSGGLNILFDKLQQGCAENDEVLALAAARADAEEQYGNKLRDIKSNLAPKKGGFGRDDGASLRKAYEGIISEMGEEGRNHVQVADNIKRMVLAPFGKWADEHRQRVDYSQSVLKGKLKHYERELTEVQKAQKRYFNKCRVLEDLKESEINGTLPELQSNTATPVLSQDPPGEQHRLRQTSTNSSSTAHDTSAAIAAANAAQGHPDENGNGLQADIGELQDPVELAGDIYSPDEAGDLFRKMLEHIPQKSVKVAILGTYENVSSGDQIVAWVLQNISMGSLAQAEQFGQCLVNSGYLRLVGQVGSKFANSSVFNYQWRKKAFILAGKDTEDNRDLISPYLGGYLGDTINSYINNPHPDETSEERLTREVAELDHRYKINVAKLDDLRCNLEESVIDHLKFMERCEFDRLKAIKAVFLDFLASLSNVVPSIQSAIDKQLLFQETVHPANDLRYILESYQTGSFSPKVTVYDNYYNSTEDQTFGVDMELRCRGDKKKVPYIVSAILSHMDAQYPDLDNDEVRLGAWTVSVPLNSTHRLRKKLNTGRNFPKEILQNFEAPIVASVLKLYLVELPDSLIPSQYYDIFKTIYSQHGNDDDPRPRISAIQNTFAQLRVTNIATLDAITTHLTRLTSITKADTEYLTKLAQEFSHCILRPRTQSSLTIADRHSFRLVYDLLTHREQIFRELKRNNSGLSSRSSSTREKPLSSVSDSPPAVRRASLQNRLDALSLRIRKSASNSAHSSVVPSREVSQQTHQEEATPEQTTSDMSPPESHSTPEPPQTRPLPDTTKLEEAKEMTKEDAEVEYENGDTAGGPKLHSPVQLKEPEGPSFQEDSFQENDDTMIHHPPEEKTKVKTEDVLENADPSQEGGHENPVVID